MINKGEFMKSLFVFIAMSISLSSMAQENSKKVLMLVSEGFYAPEYYVPLAEFKKAGFKITTATKYKRATRPDERHITTYPAVDGDITFNEISVSDYDAIVFAGGNGAWEDFFPNQDVHKALTEFMKRDKVVALLCSATGLLGVANNLSGDGQPIAQGRSVTGYEKVKGLLVQLGKVNYSAGQEGKPHVVVDGNLITGRDQISSELFAITVTEKLK